MGEGFTRWLAKHLVRHRLPLLLICLAFTAAVFPISQSMKYDRSVRSFFDADNPHLSTYARSQKDFGGDTLCLAVYTDPDLLTTDGLLRLDSFTRRLASIPGILQASSLADMRSPLDPASLREISRMLAARDRNKPGEEAGYLPPLAERFQAAGTDLAALRDAVIQCDMYADQFIGSDGQTTAVFLLADPVAMGSGQFTETLAQLRRIAAEHPFPARIVGAPVMINDVYDFLDEDAWVLANVSTLATILVVAVLFRRIRWMILPLVVVHVCLIWMRAVMAANDIQLSITSSLTTALITVIGIATSIHVALRFQDEFARDGDPVAALERMLRRIMAPVFWTCATTAMGFLSLATSRVVPVRDFGVVMALASLAVCVAAFLIMPAGILLGGWGIVPRRVPAEPRLVSGLDRMNQWVCQHSLRTAVLIAGVTGLALWGFRWTAVETDFTRNFRDDSLVIEGYRYVEATMGGAGFVEVVFDVPEHPTPADLDRVRTLSARLREITGVTKVTGLTDFLDFFSPPAVTRAAGRIAGSAALVEGMRLTALRKLGLPEVRQVWNPLAGRMRLVLRVREQQSTTEKALLLRQVETVAREHVGSSAKVTGLYFLLVTLIDGLLDDQWRAAAVSTLGIIFMMSVAFGGLRMGLVAFLPNLIPMAVVVGIMGWLGLKLNVATAMIQSISMGLAVDFSIHYLTRFMEERRAGNDFYTALSLTHQGTGKAMVCASLALIFGFGVLTFSNFLPTIHFGFLVSVAMVGGLVGNLMTLPVLLRLFYWVKDPPPSHLLATLTEQVQKELARSRGEPAVRQP